MATIPSDYDLEAAIEQFRINAQRETDEREAKIRQNYEIALICDQHGWKHDYATYSAQSWCIDVQIPIGDLNKARLAFGKLTYYGKDLESHVGRLIRVSLRCEAWSQLRLSYVKPLAPGSKCQIVKQTDRPRTEHVLVCSR